MHHAFGVSSANTANVESTKSKDGEDDSTQTVKREGAATKGGVRGVQDLTYPTTGESEQSCAVDGVQDQAAAVGVVVSGGARGDVGSQGSLCCGGCDSDSVSEKLLEGSGDASGGCHMHVHVPESLFLGMSGERMREVGEAVEGLRDVQRTDSLLYHECVSMVMMPCWLLTEVRMPFWQNLGYIYIFFMSKIVWILFAFDVYSDSVAMHAGAACAASGSEN